MALLLILPSQCPCRSGRTANPLLLLVVVVGIWLLASWIKRVFRKEGDSLMNKIAKVAIVLVLIVAVVIVIAVKQRRSTAAGSADSENPSVNSRAQRAPAAPEVSRTDSLPRLVDLGAGKCIPCKMMAPILEELKDEYAGSMRVDVFDIEKNPDIADKYRVRVIPTQIFFDASGKELFRHEGFMANQDILAKWAELGVELTRTK